MAKQTMKTNETTKKDEFYQYFRFTIHPNEYPIGQSSEWVKVTMNEARNAHMKNSIYAQITYSSRDDFWETELHHTADFSSFGIKGGGFKHRFITNTFNDIFATTIMLYPISFLQSCENTHENIKLRKILAWLASGYTRDTVSIGYVSMEARWDRQRLWKEVDRLNKEIVKERVRSKRHKRRYLKLQTKYDRLRFKIFCFLSRF